VADVDHGVHVFLTWYFQQILYPAVFLHGIGEGSCFNALLGQELQIQLAHNFFSSNSRPIDGRLTDAHPARRQRSTHPELLYRPITQHASGLYNCPLTAALGKLVEYQTKNLLNPRRSPLRINSTRPNPGALFQLLVVPRAAVLRYALAGAHINRHTFILHFMCHCAKLIL